MKRNGPLQRHTGLSRKQSAVPQHTDGGSSLQRISRKQSTQLRKYSKTRNDHFSEAENRVCYIQTIKETPELLAAYRDKAAAAGLIREFENLIAGCEGTARTIHHARGRGKELLNTSTYESLSASCHRLLEDRPALAELLDITQSRLHE